MIKDNKGKIKKIKVGTYINSDIKEKIDNLSYFGDISKHEKINILLEFALEQLELNKKGSILNSVAEKIVKNVGIQTEALLQLKLEEVLKELKIIQAFDKSIKNYAILNNRSKEDVSRKNTYENKSIEEKLKDDLKKIEKK